MRNNRVAFICPLNAGNLGIGYISSVLTKSGFETRQIDFEENKHKILRLLKRYDPLLIGFSVIFQYNIQVFSDLISFLRKHGLLCHFTAGGHYASLKPVELFGFIPELDSIGRFEGEYLMLQLARYIQHNRDWRIIPGIAYQKEGELICLKPKELEKSLDKFPYPYRSRLNKFAFELPYATIIAGRGCTQNCTFCNEREFFRMAGGPVKRVRNPLMVAEEMKMLYEERHCRIFLFLDDDFPVSNSGWIQEFCTDLEKMKLSGKILWKICCRADEIEEKNFFLMRKHGLFLTFLGVEDGTDSGLRRLKKNLSVSQILAGIETLKKLRIGIDYGFLLFQPTSSFQSVKKNLDFLRLICHDGYMPVTFLKAMPFYSTAMEKELIAENRLIVRAGLRDYKFPEDWMDLYYSFISSCLEDWLINSAGLKNNVICIRNNFLVFSRFFNNSILKSKLYMEFCCIVSRSNEFLTSTMAELLNPFKTRKCDNIFLRECEDKIKRNHEIFLSEVLPIGNELYEKALKHAFKKIQQCQADPSFHSHQHLPGIRAAE